VTNWNDLPSLVRAFVEEHTGPVVNATDTTNGRNSDFSAVLRSHSGDLLFLKGVHGVSPRMRWLRNEITAGALAPGITPAVLFHADVADWLIVGFEHLPGRAADLSPGSPDLSLVAKTVIEIGGIPAPDLRPLHDRWDTTDWWNRLAEEAPAVVEGWVVEEMSRRASLLTDLVRGDRLVHTDLHGDQFILGDDEAVHVIDWGMPGAGAPWVDGAFLVLRLIEAGHATGEAERWALSLPGFATVDHGTALDAFSAYIAGLWTCWTLGDNVAPGAEHRARLARDYAASRQR